MTCKQIFRSSARENSILGSIRVCLRFSRSGFLFIQVYDRALASVRGIVLGDPVAHGPRAAGRSRLIPELFFTRLTKHSDQVVYLIEFTWDRRQGVFLRRPVPTGRRVAATILRNALTHGDSEIYVKDFLRLKFIIQLVSFSANNTLEISAAEFSCGLL